MVLYVYGVEVLLDFRFKNESVSKLLFHGRLILPPRTRVCREDWREDHHRDPAQGIRDETDQDEHQDHVNACQESVAEHEQEAQDDVAGINVADAESLEEQPAEDLQECRSPAGFRGGMVMMDDHALAVTIVWVSHEGLRLLLTP